MKKNILVTGVPRSGTTFLGRVIAFSSQVNYLWEPFNKNYRKGLPDYYPYLGETSSDYKVKTYKNIINQTINFENLDPVIKFLDNDSIIKKIIKSLGINRTFFRYKWSQIKNILLNKNISLFKDPIGVFLSEFLIKAFNFKIILVIRHPAAIVNSRRNLGWEFDFSWWKNQKDLYLDHFKYIEEKMKNYNDSLVVNSAFHWLTCYSYMLKIKEKYPESVLIVRHEDLCTNSTNEFQNIYNYLNIKLTRDIELKINNLTNGSEVDRKSTDLAKLEKRNSEKLVSKWKNNISNKELSIINNITNNVSNEFFETDFKSSRSLNKDI